jgi:hypothetical protein
MTDEPDVRYEVSDIRLRYQTVNSASIFSNPKTLNPPNRKIRNSETTSNSYQPIDLNPKY